MTKLFTKLFCAIFFAGLLLTNTNANAQTTAQSTTDTSFHPVRRLWGYAFGDLYYAAHAEPTTSGRGPETNYAGVPTYRNAFQFRRVYLGYDYDINRKFSVQLLLASEPSANVTSANGTTISNSDNLADNKMAFFIKLINLRTRDVWPGTDLVIGQMFSPGFVVLSEQIWGYRAIEKTISDFHGTNAYDLGAGLQGVFDPATKNYGYDLMVGDNTQARLGSATVNNGFYKEFYGDIYAKFFNKKLILQLYSDYVKTTTTNGIVGQQSHQMIKGFAVYNTPQLTVGVEAYTNKLRNAVTATDGTNKTIKDATAKAISIFAHGPINKDKLGWFARYDGYTPDNDFQTDESLNASPISNYNLYTKERFVTAGLDFTPAKNIHFEPNIWFIKYKDDRPVAATGYIPDNHTLIYRMTLFYQFGK